MNRRRASTLVELMVCLSAGSTLMLVAIGLVHQTLKISREVSQHADHDRSLARLATLFRRDAHHATGASIESETELRMTRANDSEVIYRFADQRITREYKLASGEVENEGFAVDQEISATFESSSDPNQAALLVRRDTGLHDARPRIELHVVAVLSKLRGAEQGGGETKP